MSVKQYWEDLFFLSKKIRWLFAADLLVSWLWFFGETSFLVVMQGFLVALGVLNASQARLPDWYPLGLEANLLCLVGFGALRSTLTMLKMNLTARTSHSFTGEIRREIAFHVLNKRHHLSTSEVVSLYGEVANIAGSYIAALTNFLHGAMASVLFLAVTFYVAPIEAVVGLLALVGLILPFRRMVPPAGSLGKRMNYHWREGLEILISGLKNLLFLRLYRMTTVEAGKAQNEVAAYERAAREHAIVNSVTSGVPQFIGTLVLALAAWVGLRWAGTPPMVLVSFFYLFVRFSQTTSSALSVTNNLKFTRESFKKLRTMVLELRACEDFQVKVTEAEVPAAMVLGVRDLSCSYENGEPLFEKLSFSITPSKFVLVKGASGSGKSTLLKALLGAHPLRSGAVTLNERSLVYGSELAKRVGYVGPDPFLIHGTVRDNLLYGNVHLTPSDQELWDTLNAVGLDERFRGFSHGLDEILREDAQLSTGQKQRLAFARALLRKPSLMVLDEATANIDQETELRLIQLLKTKKNLMAAFIISHKNSFDDLADEVILLGKTL